MSLICAFQYGLAGPCRKVSGEHRRRGVRRTSNVRRGSPGQLVNVEMPRRSDEHRVIDTHHYSLLCIKGLRVQPPPATVASEGMHSFWEGNLSCTQASPISIRLKHPSHSGELPLGASRDALLTAPNSIFRVIQRTTALVNRRLRQALWLCSTPVITSGSPLFDSNVTRHGPTNKVVRLSQTSDTQPVMPTRDAGRLLPLPRTMHP